jgi:hypothetical protein
MVKRAGTRERIKRQAARDRSLILHDELVAAVCKYICRGLPVAEIRDEVRSKLGISLNREEPYRLIAFAAQRGWLRFQAPLGYEIAEQIKNHFRGFRLPIALGLWACS